MGVDNGGGGSGGNDVTKALLLLLIASICSKPRVPSSPRGFRSGGGASHKGQDSVLS